MYEIALITGSDVWFAIYIITAIKLVHFNQSNHFEVIVMIKLFMFFPFDNHCIKDAPILDPARPARRGIIDKITMPVE